MGPLLRRAPFWESSGLWVPLLVLWVPSCLPWFTGGLALWLATALAPACSSSHFLFFGICTEQLGTSWSNEIISPVWCLVPQLLCLFKASLMPRSEGGKMSTCHAFWQTVVYAFTVPLVLWFILLSLQFLASFLLGVLLFVLADKFCSKELLCASCG